MYIQLKDITKTYSTKNKIETNALKDVNLEIERGEFVAIIGTSGSGKTTLLNILGGMDTATSGNYLYDGMDVTTLSKKKLNIFRKEKMGFVFQNFELIDWYNVYENVEVPLLARNIRNRKKKIEENLNSVGILNLKKKYPSQLSGGEKQRCAIARALATGNELILADEPTGALDQKNGQMVMELLKK